MAKQTPHEYFSKWLKKQPDLLQSDVAKVACVHPSMIVFWKKGIQPIHAEKALLLEAAYKNRGLCADKLCPLVNRARKVLIPSITGRDLEIIREDYYTYTFPENCVVIAIMTLKNGFTVTGESEGNFDIDIGRAVAKAQALNKISDTAKP